MVRVLSQCLFLATKNSLKDVVLMVILAYFMNVVLHLLIAELSYNNGGLQLVKSFEGELFKGKGKKIFSWVMFTVYGLAIVVGVSGNINGGAGIIQNWLHVPFSVAQLIYYLLAGIVVFYGNEGCGNCPKVYRNCIDVNCCSHERRNLYTPT